NIFSFANIMIHQKEFSISKPIKSWIEFKNENLTRQKYDYSCGSASLSTILKYYYDLDIGEKEILDTVLKSKGYDISKKEKLEDGDTSLSFLDLANYSNDKGFKAIGLALDLDELSKLKAPVILFVKIRKSEHFTIYKNMDKNYVYLADPSFGNIKVKVSKFKEMFYQRDNLQYPGKLLAILPITNKQKDNIQHSFMKIKKSSNFIYENIKDKLIRN
ncbi:MAG: C39 family peptidase, partial [Campylobacterota bacterium]|nr:C39 family peptidase [Campylobacterota bacterium]